MNDNREKITKYLARFAAGATLRGDQDLFSSGFITSLSAMQLVAFIEKEFQITIENEDLRRDNFHTIDALTQLVERKTTEGAGGAVATP